MHRVHFRVTYDFSEQRLGHGLKERGTIVRISASPEDLSLSLSLSLFPKLPDRLCGSPSLVPIRYRRKAAGAEVKNEWRNTSTSYGLNACAFASYDSWFTLQSIIYLHYIHSLVFTNEVAYFSLRLELRFLRDFAKLRKASISFVVFVRLSAWNDSTPAGRIFIKLDMSTFLISVEKIQVSLKSDKNNGYFTLTPIYICDHISLSTT